MDILILISINIGFLMRYCVCICGYYYFTHSLVPPINVSVLIKTLPTHHIYNLLLWFYCCYLFIFFGAHHSSNSLESNIHHLIIFLMNCHRLLQFPTHPTHYTLTCVMRFILLVASVYSTVLSYIVACVLYVVVSGAPILCGSTLLPALIYLCNF